MVTDIGRDCKDQKEFLDMEPKWKQYCSDRNRQAKSNASFDLHNNIICSLFDPVLYTFGLYLSFTITLWFIAYFKPKKFTLNPKLVIDSHFLCCYKVQKLYFLICFAHESMKNTTSKVRYFSKFQELFVTALFYDLTRDSIANNLVITCISIDV